MYGCNPAYKTPQVDSLAQVRFMVDRSDKKLEQVSTYIHPDDQCSKAQKLRDLASKVQLGGVPKEEVNIGMLKHADTHYDPYNYIEVKVNSNERLNFTMIGASWLANCYISASFQPIKNNQYEVLFTHVYMPDKDDNYCKVDVFRLVKKDGDVAKITDTPIKQKKPPCWHFYN